MNLKRVSLVATAVLTVAVVSLLFRRSLFAQGPIALTLQGLAAALMVWARVTLGGRSFHAGADPTEGGLVTKGPYRLVRHPIYAAVLIFVWAGVASHGVIDNVLAAIVATASIAVRIGAEEQLLLQAYAQYAEYERGTKRIIPFVL